MVTVMNENKFPKNGKKSLVQGSIDEGLKDVLDCQAKDLGFLFDGIDHRRQWSGFAQGVTRQDLRVTNKTLLQMIGNLDSIKNLLHQDLRTTKTFYTDLELVQKWKINKLPVKRWLNFGSI